MTKKPTYEELEQGESDHKKALEALRKSEERYRSVVEGQTELICRFTPDCTLTLVNWAYARYWNKTPDNLIGTNFLMLIPKWERQALKEHFASFSPQEPVKMIEHEVIVPNTTNSWQQWTNHAFFNEKGDIVEFQSVGRDITERKQIEETLRKSEEKYRDLYDNAPDMHVSVDAKTAKIIDCNQTTAKELGYTKEEIVGRPIFDLYTPESAEYAKKNVFPLFVKTGIIKGEELQLQRKDLSPIDVSLNVSSVFDVNGNILHSRSIWRDITMQKKAESLLQKMHDNLETQVENRTEELTETNEQLQRELHNRKHTEKALRESEKKYKELFERSLDCIYIHDLEGNFIDLNPAALKTIGYTKEEIISLNFATLLSEDGLLKASNDIRDIMLKSLDHDLSEYKLKKKNGDYVYIETKGSLMYKDGKPYSIMGIARDITDRKHGEKKLMKLYGELEKRVEDRTRDLAETNKELEEKTGSLEEANTALKVLLKKRGEDQLEIEEKIIANVNELIIPLIETLKQTKLDERQSAWLEILEANLSDIISPFSRELHSKYMRLTAMEFQVANFVRSGKSTKEIAKLLGVAKSTVDTYRNNIRKKLGIKNKKINLKTYLFDLE